jgi:hypothetical protein
MGKDPVAALEQTRQRLIKDLLEKKKVIDDQLERLGHKKAPNQ